MRDIRSDLQERAKAAEERFCPSMPTMKKRSNSFKQKMISKLIEFENADMGKVPPMAQPAALPPLSQVVVPLLNESGAPLTSLAQAIGFKKVG